MNPPKSFEARPRRLGSCGNRRGAELSERRGRVAVSGREAEITHAHAAANDGRHEAKLDRDQRLEQAERAESGKRRPPKKLCSVCQNAVAAEYVWWIEDTAVAFVCSGCFGRPRPADPTLVRHAREWQITQEAPASLRSSFTSPGVLLLEVVAEACRRAG